MIERSRMLHERQYLHTLRQRIPFLQQIPDPIYYDLDASEFHMPLGSIAVARNDLEEGLGQFVMTYRRDKFNLTVPPKRHLCANIKGAELTEEQLLRLQEQEQRFRLAGISFVAYQNPLELIEPSNSALATFYQQRGLL